MLKYGCYCLNCFNRLIDGTCTVESLICDSNYKEGNCPVTSCMMFKPKAELAIDPCVYFDTIEKSGLSMF